MLRLQKKILVLLILFLNGSLLYSDPCYNPSDVQIRENFFSDDIIGYYLSTFNFDSGESDVLLFDYSIDLSEAVLNSSCGSQGSLPEDFKLFLDFDIQIYVPEYDDFSSGPTELVDGRVEIYNFPLNLNELNFRNTDLNFDTTELQGGTKFDLIEHNIHIDESDIEGITDDFLQLSRLPNGSYYFNFYLRGPAGEELGNINKEITIFVPTYLELLTPGSESVSDSLSNTIMTNNPIFQWNSDFCSDCNISLRVCEFRSNDHSSLAEAIEDYSVLPIETGFYQLENSSINSFQYPLYDANPLVSGNFYVWQLKRSYNTTNGTTEEFSNIFIFRIQPLEPDDQSSIFSDENLEILKQFIGEEKYIELFGSDGELENYSNVDPILNLNGQDMSITYLLELIDKLNSGEIEIIEVIVE